MVAAACTAILIFKYNNSRKFGYLALVLTILRFDMGLFQETDIINHKDAFKLVPNTVLLFYASYLNLIFMANIMKQYGFILSMLNSFVITAGVLYRIHPSD